MWYLIVADSAERPEVTFNILSSANMRGDVASTRVRHLYADEGGDVIGKIGSISISSAGKSFVKDLESGYRLPIDNVFKWEALGKPQAVQYQTGFSLAGPRAIVLGADEIKSMTDKN